MATFTAYWQALAQAFDDLILASSSAATSSTVTLPLLGNAHASASADRYNGRFLYVVSGPGAGAQRTVRTGGYAPGTGIFTFDPTTTAPTSSVIALTGLFPVLPSSFESKTDYRSIINRALGMLVVPDRLNVTVTAGVDSYATTAHPWLDRPERIRGWREVGILTGKHPRACDWRGLRLSLDGIAPVIEIDVPWNGTLFVDVLRPANTLISGGASTVGLVNESDTASPDVESVVRVAKPLALEVLMHRSPGYPSGNWAEMYPAAVRDARSVRYYDRSSESPQAAAVPEQAEAA